VHFCGKDFVVKEKIRLENLKVSLFKWLFLVEVLLLVTCNRTSTKKSHLNNDTSSVTGYM
jgi:hypothetical protein